MTRFPRVRSLVSALFFRRGHARDLNDELAFHVEARTRDLIASGAPPSDAAAQARAELGDPARWHVDAREARGLQPLDELAGDLRIAVRMLARTPGFTITALVTLAMAIGGTTAIFGQINAVYWRTLPVRDPLQLRTLLWTSPSTGFLNTPAFRGPDLPASTALGPPRPTFASYSYPVYKAMRDGARTSFSDLACWMDPGELLPVVMGEMGFGSVQFVSGNYFRTLGVDAGLGRTLRPEDDADVAGSTETVAVISHQFWERGFGRDPNVLGRTIGLNGTMFSIVGVLREGFFGLDPSITPDVMVPMATLHIASAGGPGVLQTQANWSICRVIGRLRAGVSDEQARADAAGAAMQSLTTTPNWPPRGRVYEWPAFWIVQAAQGIDSLRAPAGRPMLILMTLVGVILLIACANIAGLLLARGTAREREIATRVSLGAPRARVMRQLLTESLLLSAAGGVAGVALAFALARSTPSLLSQLLPMVNGSTRTIGVSVAPDARVLLFSACLVIAVGLVFGVLPAWRATRVDVLSLLQQSAAGGLGRAQRLVSGKGMVALQTALAILLLIGAGLFIRTVSNLRSAPLGYRTEGLLYVRIEPRGGGMRTGSEGLSAADSSRRRGAFFEEVVKRLGESPGVVSASAAVTPPLSSYTGAGGSDEEAFACTRDFTPADPREGSYDPRGLVAPRFFETIGLPLLLGRDFEWAERSLGRQKVVIVNDAFVRKFFQPGRNPVGETLGLGRDCPSNTGFATIVGVVADSKALPRGEARPTIYQMYGVPARPLTVILRTNGDAASLLPAIRRSMAQFNAGVPLFGEATPADLLDQQIRQERLLSALFVGFGAVALLLCCVGICGLLAYNVGGRTPEIGLRMALGAQRRDVMVLILGESLLPVAIGVAVGIGASFALTRSIQSLLFGVSGPDARGVAAALATFLFCAAVGAILPARWATRVEPVTALRCA